MYKFGYDDIINFGSDVKSVFTLLIAPEDEKQLLSLNHEFNVCIDRDYISYFVLDEESKRSGASEVLSTLGITQVPSMIVRFNIDISETTFVLNFGSIAGVLSYLDVLLAEKLDIKTLEGFDPSKKSRDLRSYLKNVQHFHLNSGDQD